MDAQDFIDLLLDYAGFDEWWWGMSDDKRSQVLESAQRFLDDGLK